jgi:Holliday junction resolvase RusA-like endonuclease
MSMTKHSPTGAKQRSPVAVSSDLGAVLPGPRSFSFKCDMPPSANAIWRSVKGRVLKSKAYRDWLYTASWYAKTENKGRYYFYEGPLTVQLNLPRQHAASDLDNRIKPLLDALQAGGIIKNDNLVHRIEACWRPKTFSDQTFAWVTVTELT